jgi:hypothetical protein
MSQPPDPLASLREKFATYRALSAELGPALAWERMLVGSPERQKQVMGPLLDQWSLPEAFARAVPYFKLLGADLEVVDVSTPELDAALQIQRACPSLALCGEYGFSTPCHVVCELDVEATHRAYPKMQGTILCRLADGSSVCVFKYQRPRRRPVAPMPARTVPDKG